jgi:hypothetical protein
MSSSEELPHAELSRPERPPSMWVCGRCTLENREGEVVCAACEAPRAQGRGARPSRDAWAGEPAGAARGGKRRVASEPAPTTLEEFMSSGLEGEVTLTVTLDLPTHPPSTVEKLVVVPAERARAQLAGFAPGAPYPGLFERRADAGPARPAGVPTKKEKGGGSAGRPLPVGRPVAEAAVDSFNTPTANAGAFGGERVGLPHNPTRHSSSRRGPPQKPMARTLRIGTNEPLALRTEPKKWKPTPVGGALLRPGVGTALTPHLGAL